MNKLLMAAAVTIFTSLSWAHDGVESRVTLESEAAGSYSAGQFNYSFQLVDTSANKSLSDKDLSITNTKILHFIAYDSSRNEFNHVHPVFNGKFWSVDLNLLVNGQYFFWAQGQLLDGTEFSVFTKALIKDGKPELPVIPLVETRNASDRMTTVTVDNSKLKAGVTAMLSYKVSRLDGKAAVITPYLGSIAHIIAAAPDGDELIHVHPMAVSDPNSGMVHATFPSAGDYRLWVQLNDQGELKTIPLSVVVSK